MRSTLLLLAQLATAPDPSAPPSAGDARWRGAVEAGTDFPVSLGVKAHVEAPFRLRASTSLGFLPGAYVDAMNGVLTGVGAYPDATAELIRSSIQNSLVWRTHVGGRPFPGLGLYGEVGYGLVALGGQATAADIVSGVTGRSLPEAERGTPKTFDASAMLHMADVEIGYAWTLGHLHLRASLGGAFTFASSTTITPKFTPRAPNLMREFTSYGEAYLDDTFTSYVFTPVLGVGAGYAF